MKALTTHDIITHLTRHGSVIIWAEYEGCTQAALSSAITAWRNNASPEARRRVAVELSDAGLDWRTITRVTGLNTSKPSAPAPAPAPPVSRAEAAADAAHIQKWGHV